MKITRTQVRPCGPDSAQTPSRGVRRSLHEVAGIPSSTWRRRGSSRFREIHGQRRRVVVPWNNVTPTTIPPQQPNPREITRRTSNILQTSNQQVLSFPGYSNLLNDIRELPEAQLSAQKHVSLDETHSQQNALSPPTIWKESSELKSQFCIFGYSLAPLYDFWERLQVTHCGQYSIERMLALDEYRQRASIPRVMAVCFLFPLGPLLVIICTEFLPLQSVEKGARANYVFWIRHTLMGIILIVCAMAQAKAWISEMPLSMTQIVTVAIGSAVVYTSLNLVIADLWVFPIPFLIVAGAPLLFSIWAIASRIALGPHPMEGIEDGEFRGRRFLLLTSVHAALLGIYPAYQAVFLAVDGACQLLVVLMMPALNLALKNLQTAWGSHLEDSLPAVIVFTCDVFGTIYSVLCMQSASSMKMVAVIVALNCFVVLMSLYGMNRRSRIARACRALHGSPFQQQLIGRLRPATKTTHSLSTLVIAIVNLLKGPGQLDATELREIRLLSGMQHELSDANSALLASLGARSIYKNERRPSQMLSMGQMKSQYAAATVEGRKLSASHFVVPSPRDSKLVLRLQAAIIVPMGTLPLQMKPRGRFGSLLSFGRETRRSRGSSSDGSATETLPRLQTLKSLAPRHSLTSRAVRVSSGGRNPRQLSISPETLDASVKLLPVIRTSNPVISTVLDETRRQNTRAVKQTLQLLFNNEYLGLIAYTQCFIPVIYLVYMPFLRAMPNRSYYPTHYRYFGDTQEFTERMAVIAALAALQFAALVAVQVVVARRFGVSTIYQVAFVLETQFLFLQGRLTIWLIFAVQSTLAHYGADFTFQFAWVASS